MSQGRRAYNMRDNGKVTRAADRLTRMQVVVFPTLEAHARADADYWRALPTDVRVRQVWRLSVEQSRLRGEYRDEPGLCRSVARVVRA